MRLKADAGEGAGLRPLRPPRSGGMRGPKAKAGLPLWLQTLEQGKDRKMPDS